MDREQFSALIEKCYKELGEKQDRLIKEYKISEYKEYSFDQEKSILEFKNDDSDVVRFKMIIIGTWSSQKDSWMWAWANSTMTDNIRKDSEQLKKLFEITQLDLFAKSIFECDEDLSYDFAALSVYHLGASGFYRALHNLSYTYIAVMDKIG